MSFVFFVTIALSLACFADKEELLKELDLADQRIARSIARYEGASDTGRLTALLVQDREAGLAAVRVDIRTPGEEVRMQALLDEKGDLYLPASDGIQRFAGVGKWLDALRDWLLAVVDAENAIVDPMEIRPGLAFLLNTEGLSLQFVMGRHGPYDLIGLALTEQTFSELMRTKWNEEE